MKITRVSGVVYRQQLKLTGPGPNFGGEARDAFETLLVKIETDAGVTGWGEAFPHRVWPALRLLIDTTIGPACVGADAADIAGLMKKLTYLYHNVGRAGVVMFGFSGIDMALWDIAGKVAGKPLYQLLGGKPREKIPAYASLLRYGNTDVVVALLRGGARPRLQGSQNSRNHRKRHRRRQRRCEAPRRGPADGRRQRALDSARKRWRWPRGSSLSASNGSRSRCGRRRISPAPTR